ncbi:hypothetical protein [Martelella radicis]|uniref:Uncharacterized protein n=1 Tax=Martelella radicis TaxID=1397476 RepID=A0A7W6PB28_9HYPH|nr:hypothetical protein [Martelella radicis]MBB4123982.1 hypothetical protein [Martelella radicis]
MRIAAFFTMMILLSSAGYLNSSSDALAQDDVVECRFDDILPSGTLDLPADSIECSEVMKQYQEASAQFSKALCGSELIKRLMIMGVYSGLLPLLEHAAADFSQARENYTALASYEFTSDITTLPRYKEMTSALLFSGIDRVPESYSDVFLILSNSSAEAEALLLLISENIDVFQRSASEGQRVFRDYIFRAGGIYYSSESFFAGSFGERDP